MRELLGTWLALAHPERRGLENVLAREQSMFCSAFVLHLFRKVGLDLAPGLAAKQTTPEDISRTPVPHVTWLLRRGLGRTKLEVIRVRLRRRGKARHNSLRGK